MEDNVGSTDTATITTSSKRRRRRDEEVGETATRKRPFSIPSISEIKRVSVVTSSPMLFKKRVTEEEGVATTDDSSERLRTNLNSTSIPANTFTSRERVGQTTVGRKRPREVESQVDHVPSKIAADDSNDRGIPERQAVMSAQPQTSGSSLSSESLVSSSTTLPSHSHHPHPHAIIANPVQKKNPVMKHVRNVPWELGDIVPDFVLGKTTCAMFLSVRYHSLHPNYIHSRLKELGKQYQLRILLVLVDMKESQKVLQELAKIALLADLTLMLAWSYEEAGRYLETYKAFENKPPDMLMERIDSNFFSRATDCLTTVKKVNKTDAATLLGNFKSMEKVITASKEDLVLCPGLGPQKAQRLFSLFHQPFKTNARKPD